MPQKTLAFAEAARLLRQYRHVILRRKRPDDIPEPPEPLSRVSEKSDNCDCGIITYDLDGVQRTVLLITGSEFWDYPAYNLRPWDLMGRLKKPSVKPHVDFLTDGLGVEKTKHYHAGFLLLAARIKRFLGDDQPDFIAGHSLGAAAAQILGTAMDTPTICFASPQVVQRNALAKDAFRAAEHPQWKVFNVSWDQDLVTKIGRQFGLKCLGYREVIDLGKWNAGIDHFLEDYEDLLRKDARSVTRRVPSVWLHDSRPIIYRD